MCALYGKLDKMALPTQLVYLLTDDTSSWVEASVAGGTAMEVPPHTITVPRTAPAV